MERIHNLLRKIQDVYYQKGDKQLIDIDLMLDYTRVLYADLLDWRKAAADTAITAPELPAEAVETDAAITAQTPVQAAEATAPVPESIPDPLGEADPVVTTTEPELIPHEPEQAEEPEAEMPVAEDTAEAETEVAVTEAAEEVVPHEVDEVAAVAEEEPAQPEVPVAEVAATAEEEVLKPILEHIEEPIQSEIHLELPPVPEETEDVSVPEPVILSVPEAKPASDHKPTSEYVFQKSFKDVRSFIGINDKYQFMNELFSNNKAAYESTLDKINFCGTLKEAEQWITNEVRGQYKWSEEDETYQSLLSTVKKYFA